ncbi:MAG TPA: CYTH domain-containing protein [Longimicrobium sp.]|jgi:class 3 adenylate cyclase
MSTNYESEFKFVSLGNIQLKFSPVESGRVVSEKVKMLCELLDITVEDSAQRKIQDEYFDDPGFTLLRNHCSLRRRLRNGSITATLKVEDQSTVDDALHRIETDFEDGEFQKLLRQPDALLSLLRMHLGQAIELGPIRHILTVHNRRTTMVLKTENSSYELAYDKYFYYSPLEGRFSEYFGEMEIEVLGDVMPLDSQLQMLRRATPVLLNSTTTKLSKVERGLRWLREQDAPKTVYVVAFDIVGYSLRTADVQKQMIMQFNKLTKEAIRQVRGHNHGEIIYLPTGDGMILIFEDHPETLLPIVFMLQDTVKRYRSTVPEQKQFSFRTGIHAGPVFKYSDVNENPNVAGNGINLAVRAMSLGDDWHIIATDAAFEAVGNIAEHLKSLFQLLGPRAVKHGVELRVYNVFDRERECGNPSPPR